MLISNKRLVKVIKYHILFLLFSLLYLYLFDNHIFSIPCVFHKITGLLCPGCGITRCFMSILHGDFYQAFKYNELVFIFLPFAIVYYIYIMYCYVKEKKQKISIDKISIPLLIITLLFGVVRNII